MRIRTAFFTVVFWVTLGMLLSACGSKTEPTATQPPAPVQDTVAPAASPDGETLLNGRCTQCHTVERVTSTKKTTAEWEQTVTRMVSKGAKLTADEQQILVDYLAKTYAP